MSIYTKLQLKALFDQEFRMKEDQFILKTSLYIKKQVVELAKKGITQHVWKSEDLISQRVLVELCKVLQNIFPDTKIVTSVMGVSLDWT